MTRTSPRENEIITGFLSNKDCLGHLMLGFFCWWWCVKRILSRTDGLGRKC